MAYYGKHPEKYSEAERYALARKLISIVQRKGRVKTEFFGTENLPKDESGYMIISNHQGKYDTVGIMAGHDRPCTVLMNKKRSKLPVADQFITLLSGQRIDSNSIRQQMTVMQNIADEIRDGRVYVVFPEGGYSKRQRNRTSEFKQGCFSCAIRAKCTIVPVAVVDSYIPFNTNSMKEVTTKVIYLPPIPYESYKDMTSAELCAKVKKIIDDELEKWPVE